MNLRIDDLQNGYFIIQDPKKFCFGVDAVLLSNFVIDNIKENNSILDLGCGNGIIPILLCAKKSIKVTGLEIQKENIELANKSVAYNNLQDKIKLVCGDIKNVGEIFKGKKFDVVVTNPPYIHNGSGLLNVNKSVAISRHEIYCNLRDVISAAAYVLNHGASFYMIHRPQRLTEIITILKENNLQPKYIKFVHSHINSEAKMVMVCAKRGAKEMCKVLPPTIIYSFDK